MPQSRTPPILCGVPGLAYDAKCLSPEQRDWFAWLDGSAVRHRCDNADDFAGILAAFLAW